MEQKTKALILVAKYAVENKMSHRFVHGRNLYYQKNGIDVTVLDFNTSVDYQFEGIKVVCKKTFCKSQDQYDILIIHQPNIRQHYVFLKKYGDAFPNYVLFFHGHEVLNINKVYSKSYTYKKNNHLKVAFQNTYDTFKLFVWRSYIPKIIEKTELFFVSKWMLEEFLNWTKIPLQTIEGHYSITYNCIGEEFEKNKYLFEGSKYDFVTIRGNLDGSKYCVDFINALAFANPSCKFLLVGVGKFFDYYEKAPNLEWKNTLLNHQQIIELLQQSKCALMPTRTDAQGLMMCEMASLGIPLITSDIPVCHEVLDEFDNVKLIRNDKVIHDLNQVYQEIMKKHPFLRKDCYYNSNTSQHEVDVIKKIAQEKKQELCRKALLF